MYPRSYTTNWLTKTKPILVVFLVVANIFSSLTVPAFFDAVPRVEAAFNAQINYQGKLTNASNVAVADGVYHMKFWLLTSPTAATSTALWTEDRSTVAGNRVTVSNGLFSVMLGSSTPLTTIDFNQTLYLGVEVGGSSGSPSWDGEMSPRKVLGAVPAAFEAGKLDGISSEQFFRTDATNATSSATTSLSVMQNGAGKVAEFFGPNASSVFSILSSGNVGVGTTSPYAKLSVAGQVVASHFAATSTTATSTFAGGATFAPTGSGLVGIGTNNPSSKLHVFGNFTLEGNGSATGLYVASLGNYGAYLTSGNENVFRVAGASDTGLFDVSGDSGSGTALITIGDVEESTNAFHFIADQFNNSFAFTGVGPNLTLHDAIEGVTWTAANNGGVHTQSFDGQPFLEASGGAVSLASGVGDDIAFYLNNGTVTNIFKSSGRVGFSTTTPGTTLGLGNTGANTINLDINATSTFGSGINIRTGCFAVAGTCLPTASGVLSSIAQTFGSAQTGAITLATSSATSFNGLTISNSITNSGGTFTFAPNTISGTLSVAGGGTGATSFGQGWVYSTGGTTALAASSSPTVARITATSTTGVNYLGAQLQIATTGTTPSIYNPTTGNGLILRGDTNGAQLRIVSNTGAWSDALTTSYFQMTNSSNNNVTFMGGTFGTDTQLNRLQFNASSTQFTDLAYGSTPVPGSVFEAINSTAAKTVFKIRGATAQSGDYLNVNSVSATGGDIFSIKSSGNVGVGSTTPSSKLSVTTTGAGNLTGVYSHLSATGDGANKIAGKFYATGSGTADFVYGVYSEAYGTVDPNVVYAVYGLSSMTNGTGVSGNGWTGVEGNSNNAGGYAVRAVQSNASGYALYSFGGKNYFQNSVGIGTSSPYAMLSVAGDVVARSYTATSTATSTFAGGIQTNLLSVTSTTASSTFANGINLTAGCYAIAGSCLGSGSGTVGSGTTGQFPYYAGSGTTLTATSSLFLATTGNVGVGTTTPSQKLTVSGSILVSPSLGTNAAGNIYIGDPATIPGSYYPGIWLGSAAQSPTYTNYSFLSDGTGGNLFNAQSGQLTRFRINNQAKVTIGGNGLLINGVDTGSPTDAPTNPFQVNATYSGTAALLVNSSGNVGIGTTSPYSMLSVAGQVVAQNYVATSTTATSTFAYDASISGRLSVLQTGTNATIIGNTGGDARGSGALEVQSARTFAYQVASGSNSIVFGKHNQGDGPSSMTFGLSNINSGNTTLALGVGNSAGGASSESVVVGHGSSVAGGQSAVVGYQSSTEGDFSGAFGHTNTVKTLGSYAFGYSNFLETADYQYAFGYDNYVDGSNAMAIGYGLSNGVDGSIQIGVQDDAKITIMTEPVIGSGVVTGFNNSSPLYPIDAIGRADAGGGSTAAARFQNLGSIGSGLSALIGVDDSSTGFITGGYINFYSDTGGAGHDFYGNGNSFMQAANIPTLTATTIGVTSYVRTGVGSASTPNYSFSADTNTGMYNTGSSDILSFATNGVQRMTLDASGNVGIGTSSPYAMLSVAGDVVARSYTATSTTATSTFAGGFSARLLNVTSSTASSTFANGINLTAGCFAIAGTCVGGSGGSGTVGSGTTGQFPYYAGSGTTLTATSTLSISTAGNFTISGDASNTGTRLSVTGGYVLIDNNETAAAGSLRLGGVHNKPGIYANSDDLVLGSATDIFYLGVPGAGLSGTALTLNAGKAGIGTGTGTIGSQLTVNGNAAIGASYTAIAAPSNGLIVQGNVGVATSSPATTFSVGGNGYFTGGVGVGVTNTTAGTLNVRATGSGGNPVAQLIVPNKSSASRMLSFNEASSGADWNIWMGTETVPYFYVGGSGGTSQYFWRANWNDTSAPGNTFKSASDTANQVVVGIQGASAQSADYVQVTTSGSTAGNIFKINGSGNVGIGTTSPYAKLSVHGQGVFTQEVRANYFTATSTTATSTFAGFIDVNGTGTNATSTFASNLWVKGALRIGTSSLYLDTNGISSTDGTLKLRAGSTATSTFPLLSVGTTTATTTAKLMIDGAVNVTSSNGAVVIGNTLGNARGTRALDIQTNRTLATQVASGLDSIAIGNLNTASSQQSTVVGYSNVANSGTQATAVGNSNTASGPASISAGFGNGAYGTYSTAVGSSNTSAGDYATTLGYSNNAGAYLTTAVGISNTITAGESNVAFGNGNSINTNNGYSGAIGISNTIESTASGSDNSFAVGYGNTIQSQSTGGNSAFGIGNIVSYTNGAEDSYAFGKELTLYSSNTIAFGYTDSMKLTLDRNNGWFGNGIVGNVGTGSLCFDSNNASILVNDFSDSCTSSTRETKHDIQNLEVNGLEMIKSLNPVSFVYNNGNGRVNYGFIAEESVAVDDRFGTYNGDGVLTGVDTRAFTSVTIKAIQEIASRISLTAAPTSTPSIAINSIGNVGFGIEDADYKIQAAGDIGGYGFAIESSRSAVSNVEEVDQETIESYAEKIRDIELSTYSYEGDTSTSTRLGILSHDAPSEILTVQGDVDMYKLAVFTVGVVQAQQLRLDDIEARLEAVEAAVLADGGSLLGNPFQIFEDAGITITETFAQFKNVLTAGLTVGSEEKPTGITLYDVETGSPYCVKVKGGKLKNFLGACEEASDVEVPDDEEPTPPVDDNTPTDTGTPTTPEPTDETPTEPTTPDVDSDPEVATPDAPTEVSSADTDSSDSNDSGSDSDTGDSSSGGETSSAGSDSGPQS